VLRRNGIFGKKPMSCHDHTDEMLGLDFAQNYRIRCLSWHLGTFERHGHIRREWALRMQRQDGDGQQRSLTWLHDLPGHEDLDWDWAIFLLARDAGDGRQSFDAYIEEHLSQRDDDDIPRHEHHDWVRAEHLWHQIRDFLGRDPALLTVFFDILPPER
jgi:hypothetical protein